MLNPGKYIHSVKIKGATQTLGDSGTVERGTKYQGKRRCYVIPQGESESRGYDGTQTDNRYRVVMRLDECLTSDKLLVWKDKTLKITGLQHFDKNRETVIECVEHPTRLAGD